LCIQQDGALYFLSIWKFDKILVSLKDQNLGLKAPLCLASTKPWVQTPAPPKKKKNQTMCNT
jgi:hypothetical protein